LVTDTNTKGEATFLGKFISSQSLMA